VAGVRAVRLDALRGVAALAVVVYHAILVLDVAAVDRLLLAPLPSIAGWYDRGAAVVLAVFNGYAAVMLFFVLSGAVLMASLHRLPAVRPAAVAAFCMRRVLRIYPMLLVCLAAFVAVANALNAALPGVFPLRFTLEALVANATLTAITVHGATWTLQAELLAVPLLVAAHLAWRVGGLPAMAAIAAGAAWVQQNGLPAFDLTSLRTSVFCLALGLLVPQPAVARCARLLPRHGWAGALAAMLAVRLVLPPPSLASTLGMPILGFVAVAALYHGAGGAILERPGLQALGRISYSLYLVNVVVMNVLLQPAVWALGPFATAHFLECGLVLAAATLAISIPLSSWTTRRIEDPFIALGRRMSARLAHDRRPAIAAGVS
jgi:peptidoglycan/LPS O-acetylase OafA/YrhL